MKQNKETLKEYFETGDKPTQQQYSDLIDSYVDSKQPEGEANRRFVIDEKGEVSVALEKTTPVYTLSDIVANKLSLLKDGEVIKEIGLSTYVDDANLSRLVSGAVNENGLATFTRDDNSIFTVDLSNLKGSQVKSDFNQTDETKPDFIKGFPLAVLDYNGVKKFDAKEIQFDDNFNFNATEKEVQLNKDSFRILAAKSANSLGMYFLPSSENSFKQVTQSIGSVFSSYNVHLMTFNFTFQPRASFSGGVLPKKIVYEYVLVPTNGKFNSNEGAFETTLFKVVVEDSTNITDPLENFESKQINFLSEKINSNGNIFTKLNFKEKTYDYYGNVIAVKNKTHFVQTLDFTELGYKGNKLLETLEFDLKIKATLEFEDGTNINGNNAICRTNTAFKGFLTEKI